MLKKYSDEIVDTISEDYGTRDKNSTFLSEVMSSLGSVDYSIKNWVTAAVILVVVWNLV